MKDAHARQEFFFFLCPPRRRTYRSPQEIARKEQPSLFIGRTMVNKNLRHECFSAYFHVWDLRLEAQSLLQHATQHEGRGCSPSGDLKLTAKNTHNLPNTQIAKWRRVNSFHLSSVEHPTVQHNQRSNGPSRMASSQPSTAPSYYCRYQKRLFGDKELTAC